MSWFAHAFNPAGGLRYHLRALRYRNILWKPFIDDLHAWLKGWNPRSRELIVVGASGGYCLKPEFFGRFDSIICMDVDPLAPWFFSHSHPRLPVQWERNDLLGLNSGADLHKFKDFLDLHPKACVLFSNFLGQWNLLHDQAHQTWNAKLAAKNLETALTGHAWASFHDRISGHHAANKIENPYPNVQTNAELNEFYSFKNAEFLDHDPPFFENTRSVHYLNWPLTKRHIHLIEALF